MAEPKTARSIIITPEFRGSYVNVVRPRAIEEGKEPEYSITVVLPKNHPQWKQFLARIEADVSKVLKAKFGQDTLPHSKLKHWPIQDGDASDNPDWAGHWTMRLKNKSKPGALDKNTKQPLLFEEQLYSGAWYIASMNVYAWEHKTGGRGVSFGLNNLLKTKDDEQFTSRSKAEDDFAQFLGDEGGEAAAPPVEDELDPFGLNG